MNYTNGIQKTLSSNPIFLQIALGLMVFSASQAGYYPASDAAQSLKNSLDLSDATGSSSLNFLGTAASIVSVLLSILALPKMRYMCDVQKWFLVALGYTALSCLWSSIASLTLILVIKAFVYFLGLDYVFRNLSLQKFSDALIGTSLVIALGSLFLVVSGNQTSVSSSIPGWTGLFSQKNGLAAFSLIMTANTFYFFRYLSRKWQGYLNLLILLILIIGSQGKTSLGLYVFLLAFVTLAYLARTTFSVSLRQATLINLLLMALSAFAGYVLFIYGSDISFTGRTRVWSYYSALVGSDQIFFGLGGIATSDPAITLRALSAVGAGSPHNSYLSTYVNGGMLGLIIYFVFFALCLRAQLRNNVQWLSVVGSGTIFCVLIFGTMESGAMLGLSLITLTMITHALVAQRNALQRPTNQVGRYP